MVPSMAMEVMVELVYMEQAWMVSVLVAVALLVSMDECKLL